MIEGRALTPGDAVGRLVKLEEPLSFWGGVDLRTGSVIDRNHPRCGTPLAGCVLAMPGARGSSSSASAIVELVRVGLAPAAIVMSRHDPILVIGALIADELYQHAMPIVTLPSADWARLCEGQTIRLTTSGSRASIVMEGLQSGER